MKFITTLTIALILAMAPLSVSATEVGTRSEFKECVADSYALERKVIELDKSKRLLDKTVRELNNLDSRLDGLDWDWNIAKGRLDSCRIMNNYDDRYCQYESQRLNQLTHQYNSINDFLHRAGDAFERKQDEYNSEVRAHRRATDRFNNECTGDFYDSDIEAVCQGEDTHLCNSMNKR